MMTCDTSDLMQRLKCQANSIKAYQSSAKNVRGETLKEVLEILNGKIKEMGDQYHLSAETCIAFDEMVSIKSAIEELQTPKPRKA